MRAFLPPALVAWIWGGLFLVMLCVPGLQSVLCNVLGRHHHRHSAGRVIPDAWAEYLSILYPQRQRLRIGKNHIAVSHIDHKVIVARTAQRPDNIQRLIYINAITALLVQPVFAEPGPLFLVVGGGGDLRQLNEQVIGLLPVFVKKTQDICSHFHNHCSSFAFHGGPSNFPTLQQQMITNRLYSHFRAHSTLFLFPG